MDNQDIASADQDAWVSLAQGLREGLRKCIAEMGALNPEEVKNLIEASQAAFWLHHNAATWDKRIELELARITACDQ